MAFDAAAALPNKIDSFINNNVLEIALSFYKKKQVSGTSEKAIHIAKTTVY